MVKLGKNSTIHRLNDLRLTSIFPNLNTTPYSITSPPTAFYNCIAWAFGRSDVWMWPNRIQGYRWPPDIPRNETIESFVLLFESQGYSICDDSTFQADHEKIAIYADENNIPTHAAIQLQNGQWSSKLGMLEDIEHEILGVEGDEYGEAKVFMSKPS